MSQYRSTPTDGYRTATSALQSSTESVLKTHLPLPGDEPTLDRKLHFEFLLRNLRQGFPERYTSQDASQPWLIYWTLHGFSVFGAGLDDQTKKRRVAQYSADGWFAHERDRRTIATLLAMQHPDGGFAGGPGQAAHLLPTYASVCAFAVVGRPGEGGGWDAIDRRKMYDFFMSLKQPDGSFLVSHHGEVDVRGIYCLLVSATLLNIMTPELLAGTPDFLATCQTYEGGFGNASFPGWAFEADDEAPRPPRAPADPAAPRPPLGEAHGGYTFCATASWVLLQPYLRLHCPESPARPKIDLRALLRWCVQMQGVPAELGGFKGRTNKLVDGCYSWWVGGCVVLVETLVGVAAHHEPEPPAETHADEEGDKAWDDVDDSLFDRRALQEYLLCAGQHPAGGMRDKPPKGADAYHTLYCAAGLSAAQHRVTPSAARQAAVEAAWNADAAASRDGSSYAPPTEADRARAAALRKATFAHILSWAEEEGAATYLGGSANRVNAVHPLLNLTVTHADGMLAHFYGQAPPARQPPRKKQ